MLHHGRVRFLPWILVLAATLPAQIPIEITPAPIERTKGRVIVIGVDGFDHAVCKEYIASGDLPALKAIPSV